MKLRPGLILAAAFVVMGASSCTRDYTCQCEIVYTGKPGLPDTIINSYPVKDSKKNAEKVCSEKSYSDVRDGITTVETCSIKR